MLSRLEALGVSWEEGSTSDVVQLQEKHKHPLETNASASMGRASHAESIDIALHALWINTLFTHLLAEEFRVMDTLCPRKNFLPTHEEVIRVGESLNKNLVSMSIQKTSITHRVIRVRHGIERAKPEGELVDDEVVGIILGFHNPTKSLLILCANSQASGIFSL